MCVRWMKNVCVCVCVCMYRDDGGGMKNRALCNRGIMIVAIVAVVRWDGIVMHLPNRKSKYRKHATIQPFH